MELDELLAHRDKINIQLQDILDKHTDPWGIKVSLVETKQVDLPEEMRRAIARQAEAEREKRAKIIHAEGESQAAEKLAEAANVISVNPAALQLRFLQTLTEIATEKNSTTIFPVPIDFSNLFLKRSRRSLHYDNRIKGWNELHLTRPFDFLAHRGSERFSLFFISSRYQSIWLQMP